MSRPTSNSHLITLFMAEDNVKSISKRLYTLHRDNNGELPYLFFKKNTPYNMNKWILQKNMGYYSKLIDNKNVNFITYLSQLFIRENSNLYTIQPTVINNKHYNPIDSNVWSIKPTISTYDYNKGVMNTTKKNPADLLLDDIRNMDVWRDTSEERSVTPMHNRDIPVWRKSMHVRNYDRGNDGLNINGATRESYIAPVYGVMGMSELYKKLDNRNY